MLVQCGCPGGWELVGVFDVCARLAGKVGEVGVSSLLGISTARPF